MHMSRYYSTILSIYRDEWVKSTILVRYNSLFGVLYLKCYESKRGELDDNEFNAQYIHTIIFNKVNLHGLGVALKIKITSQDELVITLKRKFSGKNGLHKLSEFLKNHCVKFDEYIFDKTGD
jgi:hypothetical protein